MRNGYLPRSGWLIAAAIVCACTTSYKNTVYQSYVVQLNGPVPADLGPSVDPFVQTVQYQATVSYFEDAAGTIPYGTSLKKKPAAFANFSPISMVQLPATRSSFALTPGGDDAALPQLSPTQTSFYVSSEIVGLNSKGTPVARARCPVQKVQSLSASTPATVTCQAFFGLIGQWNEIRPPADNRYSFGAVVLSDGRVVIGGGRTAVSDATQQEDLSSVEIYEPSTPDPSDPAGPPGTWVRLPNALSAGRSGLTATVTASNDVIFAGGFLNAGTDSETLSDAVDVFDGTTNTMLAGVAPLPLPRAEHAAALFSPETVFLGAGLSSATTLSTSVDVLSPQTVAHTGPLLISQRAYPCMVSLPETQQVLVCGGASESVLTSSCELVNATQSITAGETAAPRGDVKCAVVGQTVYLIGGTLGSTSPSDAVRIEAWSQAKITTVAAAPTGLTQHAVAAAGTLIVAAGGYLPGTTTPLATGFTLDTTTHTVTPLTGTSAMNNARADFQLVSLPDGTVMAIGGLSDDPLVPIGAEIYVP